MKSATIFLVLMLAFIGVAIWYGTAREGTFKGVPAAETTSNGSSSVNAVTAVAIANETSQASVRCFSNTGTGTLYLWLSATSTGFTGSAGVSVFTLTTFCSLEPNVWNGKVFGLMSNGTSVVTYSQY